MIAFVNITSDLPRQRTLIIAEIGVNHNGDSDLAKEMIAAAHKAGADYVKLQSFVMEDFFVPDLDYYEETASFSLSFKEQEELFLFARENNIQLITTPFGIKSVDFLDKFDVAAYKVASMDCNNLPLISHIATKGKTVFLSTGMATMGEIERAVQAIIAAGNNDYVLLHCVSNYPTEIDDVNLMFMGKLQNYFDCPVGLSDHTIGLDSVFMAATLGASVVEKHFTTNRDFAKDFPGADHNISIVPDELVSLRQFCGNVPRIMGVGERIINQGEQTGRTEMRRSWYARDDIQPGEIFSLDNIVALRPVRGLPVDQVDLIIGKKCRRNIPGGSPIRIYDIEE